jgi:small-conductance mechanosensitive channel
MLLMTKPHRSAASALLILFFAAAPLWAKKSAGAAPPEKSTAAVTLDGRPLFYVQEKVMSFSPADRARAIEARIGRLARDRAFRIDTVSLEPGDGATDIAAGDLVIMSVTEKDAVAAGMPRAELAERNARLIREAVAEHRRSHGIRNLALGASLALLATAVFVLLLNFLGRMVPKVRAAIARSKGRFPALRLQKIEILSADRAAELLSGAVGALRAAAVLLLIYFYLLAVFSLFPWTRDIAGSLFDYVLVPLRAVGRAAADYAPNVVFIIVILATVRFVLRAVRLVFDEIRRGRVVLAGFYPDWAEPTYKIVRFVVIVLTAVVVFPYLPGSDSPAFKGITVFLGVLFSLGSTSAVANVVAGVILTYMRPFRLGDRVKIADTVGDVVEKSLLVTRVRTIKNMEVTIPNAMVLGSHIANFSSEATGEGLILNTSITIGYDAPWRKVRETLIAAALVTENILEKPSPFVFQTSLNDFHVTYEVNAYTRAPALSARIYSDLHQNIQDKFNEAGIEILSPHYAALRDGNEITISADKRPQGYKPPAFRVDAGPSPRGDQG